MAKKKVTTVREHPRKVSISEKNPNGLTIVNKHPRRLDGTYLDIKEIGTIVKNYDLNNLIYPTPGKLVDYPNAEEIILEYKGLLKSESKFKMKALKNFKELYDLLKK